MTAGGEPAGDVKFTPLDVYESLSLSRLKLSAADKQGGPSQKNKEKKKLDIPTPIVTVDENWERERREFVVKREKQNKESRAKRHSKSDDDYDGNDMDDSNNKQQLTCFSKLHNSNFIRTKIPSYTESISLVEYSLDKDDVKWYVASERGVETQNLLASSTRYCLLILLLTLLDQQVQEPRDLRRELSQNQRQKKEGRGIWE